LANDDAVLAAADATVDWLIERAFRNVVLDVCNECDWGMNSQVCGHLPSLLWPAHGSLLNRIRTRSERGGSKLIVSSSFMGGTVPQPDK